jgi:hypothetical protein
VKYPDDPGPIPVTLEFGVSPVLAWLQMAAAWPLMANPMEYFIAPEGMWNEETKEWEVTGYSFIHVSHVHENWPIDTIEKEGK